CGLCGYPRDPRLPRYVLFAAPAAGLLAHPGGRDPARRRGAGREYRAGESPLALAIGNHESLDFGLIAGTHSAGLGRSVRPLRRFVVLALAAAFPAAAHPFGLVPGPAAQACLPIGNTPYRLASGTADLAVRFDPSAAAPGLRIGLADAPEDAD